MWEVFDPRDGRPILTVRHKVTAWSIVRALQWANYSRVGLDYARTGEGYV